MQVDAELPRSALVGDVSVVADNCVLPVVLADVSGLSGRHLALGLPVSSGRDRASVV